LKARGVAIVYISHRLEELIRIGDFITVLRDGRVTGQERMANVDVGWIVVNDRIQPPRISPRRKNTR